MRKFYALINNVDALRQELSWTHYRLIIKLDDERKRVFYIDECIKSNWSTRQLERQINSFYYERILSSQEANRNEGRNEIKEIEPSIVENYLINQTPRE